MTAGFGRRLVVTAGLVLVAAQTPQTQQSLSQQYADLALERASAGLSEPLRECATTADLVAPVTFGINTMTPLDDGRPLRADQFPRFLRPTHNGDFGFNNFLVLGDHETVTFERLDADAEDNHVNETWTRVSTDQVDGRLVSVFNPTWSIDVLHQVFRNYGWGIDDPTFFWGKFVVPGSTAAVSGPGRPDHVGEEERISVYLTIVPPDIPESPRTQINDEIQFTSHAVNIFRPDFGDSRVNGGDTDLNIETIAMTFFEHFEDAVDVFVVVPQARQFAGYAGFHGNVSNDIGGIGLDTFDFTSFYGSEGVLKGYEGYPGFEFASLDTVLHEQGHQYGEDSNVWSEIGPAPTVAGAIERKGHAPDGHTPLLFPGEVAYGAVLDGARRVRDDGGNYSIERTTPLFAYNPLTLYRMGLIGPGELPEYQVFLNQGQFEEDTSSSPDPGTAVTGDRVSMTVNDLMAADGTRTGAVVSHIRRAIVYVSRSGLVPAEEMDIVNYFAKRMGESSGVTTYDRYPSFAEATGGRASMTTDINPRATSAVAAGVMTADKITTSPDVRCVPVGTQTMVGATLDGAVGGCIAGGTTLNFSGTLTLTDRSDYNAVCFRSNRYGDPSSDRLFECGALSGNNRFSIDMTFPSDRPGGWDLDIFAFWPDSGSQFPRMAYRGGIEVLP